MEQHTTTDSLLVRIMRRFGLERQLARIRRVFGTTLVFFSVAFVGSLAAILLLKAILRHSSFVPYTKLIGSDFGLVVVYWRPFLYALFESAPAAFIALVLLSLAALLTCLRFVVVYWDRTKGISTSIRNN